MVMIGDSILLLPPYFEVNCEGPNGQSTLSAVNPQRHLRLLPDAVIWSDLACSRTLE
jgi:hypothetical protein